MLNQRYRVVFAAAAAIALVVPLTAAVTAETLIEARQRLMVSIVKSTKVLREMAEGRAPLRADAVKESVRPIVEAASVLPRLFPEGTESGSSAKTEIWQSKAEFDARLGEMHRSALLLIYAAQQGDQAFRFAFDQYAQGCDSCHAKFRKPE